MKKLLAMLLVALMAVSAFACAAPAGPAPDAPVLIGSIGPLTGSLAAYGNAVKNGIEMAVEEINAGGGVLGGRPLKVVSYMDDKADSTESANAFNKLVSDGVKAVIGSITSGVTAGLGTLAGQQKMLLLTPTATADTITEGLPTVFRACYSDDFQGRTGAKVAKSLGASKVAVLYASGDAYSAGLYESFKAGAAEEGLTIVATESSSSTTDTDYTAQLTNIIASGAEVIFAPYYYDSIGPYIVPQARQLGYTGAFVGADGFDGTPATMLEDKSLYENCYFTNHYAQDDPSEKVQKFVSAYISRYGEENLNALAALGYDAVFMLRDAINKAGSDDTAALITAMKGMSFEGVTGSFTLDESNTPYKKCTIITFKDGKQVFYDYIG